MTVAADYDPDMTPAEAAQIVVDAVTDGDGTSALKLMLSLADILAIAEEMD